MNDGVNERSVRNGQRSTEGQREPRGRSTIGFPYLSLAKSVEIADAVHNLGVRGCEWNELAVSMGQAPAGGGFRQKMLSARTFGLLEYKNQRVELTDLGLQVLDPQVKKKGLVEAFLAVPLFAKAYEALQGVALPQPEAVNRQMVDMGVAPRQADKVRQVFLRSAKDAGFFELSPDRLAKPSIIGPTEPPRHTCSIDEQSTEHIQEDKPPEESLRHPLIEALLGQMPPTGQKWEQTHCAMWLQTLLLSIGMLYPNRDELSHFHISVQVEPAQIRDSSLASDEDPPLRKRPLPIDN